MVTREDVRRIALSLEGTEEHMHFGALSFRRRKIFAVLREEGLLTVGLHPEDQENLLHLHPQVLTPLKGSSGAAGWTYARMDGADAELAESLLRMAWSTAAPAPRRKTA
jgi:hypothetical protein